VGRFDLHMTFTQLHAAGIGALARELLGGVRQATVMGIISRGVFLRLSSGWIIFLSNEPYRGPLTINLVGDVDCLRSLESGLKVGIRPGEIYFSFPGILISTGRAAVWTAPAPAATILSTPEIHAQLHQIAELVLSGCPDRLNQPACLLARLSGIAWGADRFEPILEELVRASKAGDFLAVLGRTQACLGMGDGLTPWGDDVNLGIYLALNRWPAVLAAGLDLPYLNRSILQAGYASTTSLSANLIECATLGQADERLALAVDSILTGAPAAQICASALLGWGSSSGVAALAGMALAIGAGAFPPARAMI
jgi:hypothetical protein